MLVVGGGLTNALFLKSKLVNEVYLTIEPRLFGVGTNLLNEKNIDVQLRLTSIMKLNKQGTLHLKYSFPQV